jgi:NAD(P)H dehydrogenase (quinone)
MSIAVSAASGRLGHAILRELVKRGVGDQLVAIARDPARMSVPGIICRKGDYNSVEQMSEALHDAHTLIMISAPVAGGGNRLAMHRNVVAAAKSAGVSRILYTSVISNGRESGTLFEDFASINQQTEIEIKESGLDWVIARNGLYLDLDVAQIRATADHGGVYSNNAGAARCGYISIAELANAYATLATSTEINNTSLNLIGTTYTQSDLVEAANEVFDLDVGYKAISFAENLERLRAIPFIAARGEAVINMLAGCFQCIELGVFDVPSEFFQVVGREPLTLAEQMQHLIS